MPTIKSGPMKGQKPDCFLNPLGIINRLNPAQLVEHELNFASKYIRLKIQESNTIEEKEKWYFDFIKLVNVRQYEFTLKWYNALNDKEKAEFMNDCSKAIYIHQEPFFNDTDFDLMCKIYDTYDFIKPFEFEGINIPLVMGELYFLRLRHDPKGKLSARATGFENLKNSPSKSKDYKYKKRHMSQTPIRLGNTEILNLLLTSDSKAISALLASYSSNEDAKVRLLEELMIGDPYDINVDLDGIDKNETQKLVETLFFNLGLELKETDEE